MRLSVEEATRFERRHEAHLDAVRFHVARLWAAYHVAAKKAASWSEEENISSWAWKQADIAHDKAWDAEARTTR